MVKVIVLGAGIVGATTAYELAKNGHAVTVIDRQPGPGLETSFANGGQISANHATPWATPESLKKALHWFGREDSPLLVRKPFDPALISWMARFIANCRPFRVAQNTERALRIALYSRLCLADLRQYLTFDYDRQQKGILHLYRTEKELQDALPQAMAMTHLGCHRRTVSRDELMAMEPALSDSIAPIAGAIFSPDDESGDAYRFTQKISEAAKGMGVDFRYGITIQGFERKPKMITAIKTDQGNITADVFVLALGSYSPIVVKDLGLTLPVYPAKGYSLTVPLGAADKAPSIALIDDLYKIVYSRLGCRLRIAGTAEFNGYNTEPNPRRSEMILRKAHDLFPGLNDGRPIEHWAGLRPMTPDQVPVLGPCRYENLVLNTGHGTLGWTMAAGSARIVSDLISGHEPAISIEGLTINRFGP